MKKLFWSAFAMSLIIHASFTEAQTESIDDFLGLESELLPELKGSQRFTSPTYHEKIDWRVEEEKVIRDSSVPNKGQRYSIIPWSTLVTEEWLSLDNWLLQREVKDATPDWKIRLRHAEHREIVGKVLQCRGQCRVLRGTNKSTAQYLSRIHEGDEFVTDKDSVAWLYMMDGTLMRISPETSVSLQEINLSQKDFFYLIRLNQGHISWHTRQKKEFAKDLSPETDSLSLPLMVKESNLQFFERLIYNRQNSHQRLLEFIDLDENAIVEQYKSLNSLQLENNKMMTISTNLMLVTPTGTISAFNTSFDAVYTLGANAFFKIKENNIEKKILLNLRGYLSESQNEILDESWYKIESNGRSFSKLEDVPGTLQVLELLTKRIKTIELAREIWVKQFTLPMLPLLSNPEKMAVEYGYTIWGDKLQDRINFLFEYTRRVETTNLKSIMNLLTRLEGSDQKVNNEITEALYRQSLKHYLLGLKSKYDNKKIRVREMSDVQYYVWILRNGKF